ncbi:hypothetical protein GCM10011390_37340 [Aureimonas endophytica]|uniref:Uncharacterized protein n=1 Tax=Aureimonas endophytica TaxID=2027858 RepID=A0A916ZUF9_9HYPH|nr:hypothetical protein [Aureimonas endophytica]GGE14738.1 hypothetical protein GCM10011390_37340 [Aureimonas endophytica]
MTEPTAETDQDALVFECELDAAPDKVWRAISIPAYRERWLPEAVLADPEPVAATPGREACYRLRDRDMPFAESVVTFELSPNAVGGTHLRIVHRLAEAGAGRALMAANGNRPAARRAA